MKKLKWRISIKSLIRVRFQNHLPRLVIHEKYENYVKWILRLIGLIGIVSSLVTIENWYLKLLFALSIFLIEQFFERAVFLYTSMYFQPFPEFTVEGEKWTDMTFAFPAIPKVDELNVLGPVFSDKKYAHDFFDLLRSWNYNQSLDTENNICLSFIVENSSEYSVYLYPNPKRKTVKNFFEEAEQQQKFEKYGKEHQALVAFQIFCKVFRYEGQSAMMLFINNQPSDSPFWLKPFIRTGSGEPEMIWEEEPILKYHFKFKERKDLDKKEVEYQHGKRVMKR